MENLDPINIVRLDGIHSPNLTLPASLNHTYTEYPSTLFDTDTIVDRIKDADVVITTTIPLSAQTIERCPKLKHIAVFAIGTNMIDLPSCAARNILVTNVPAASVESVAEHAIALFFALRRNIVGMHDLTVGGEEWVKKYSLKDEFGGCPGTCGEEVVGILGGGPLGQRVATICRALGMTASFAEHKSVPTSQIRQGKTSFTETLRNSTVLFLCLPLTPSTISLLSAAEFALMRSDALLVNVARGGIVDEEALVDAIETKRIAGAATDVFLEEPAGKENSVLVRKAKEWSDEDRYKADGEEKRRGLNGRLVLSPHIAWWARSSISKLRGTVVANVEAWAKGEIQNQVL